MEKLAVVLGGGGVTGIAWETGVLAGLADAGVDLSGANAVIGTSAGAFVGAALAGGANLERLYAAQLAEAPDEQIATVSPELWQAWATAFAEGAGDPQRIGAGFGRVAQQFRPDASAGERARAVGSAGERAHAVGSAGERARAVASAEEHAAAVVSAGERARAVASVGERALAVVSAEERARTVAARLTGTDWPPTLRITAVDAESGVLHVFRRDSGPSLVEAVSASGAVPGILPMVSFGGRQWIDGGMVSSANALTAKGFDRVVVLAPLPESYGGIPSVADDVAVLSRSAQVTLLIPDEESRAAIGPNIYDPGRRPGAAAAGRRQGAAVEQVHGPPQR